MAFWGGRRATLGTNPLAFAAPLPGGADPLVIDLAMSVAARGKIVAAERAGQAIPPDWAVDAQGNPTTDPKAALGGVLLPIGGAKGGALALMIEIMAAALTGSAYGWEASSFFDDRGGPPNMGHVLIALDPLRLSAGGYDERMTTLLDAIAAEPGRAPARHTAPREPQARVLRRASRSRPPCMPRSVHWSIAPTERRRRGELDMPEIVITEFMDAAAIDASFAGRDVLYDPQLVDDPARLTAAVREARALIVRNRTQVRGALLDCGRAARRWSDGSVWVSTTSTSRPAQRAASRSTRRRARTTCRSPSTSSRPR